MKWIHHLRWRALNSFWTDLIRRSMRHGNIFAFCISFDAEATQVVKTIPHEKARGHVKNYYELINLGCNIFTFKSLTWMLMTWLRNGLDYRHLGFWSISPILFRLQHLKGWIQFKKVIWGTFRETGLSFVLNRAYLWSVFRHTHTPWPLRWHAISKVALQLPWWYEWINHMNPTCTRIVPTTTKPKEMIQNRAYLLWDVLVHMDVVVYSKA